MLICTRLFFLPFLEKYKFCWTLFFFKQKSQVLYRPYCKIWNLNVESYASWNFVMTERMQKYVSQSKFYCIIDIHACTFWIIILCYISPYSYPQSPLFFQNLCYVPGIVFGWIFSLLWPLIAVLPLPLQKRKP